MLRRIFVSRGEPRLRTGWRLLLHGFLTLGLTIPFTLLMVAALFVLGLIAPVTGALTAVLGGLVNAVVFVVGTFLARRWLDRRSFVSLGFGLDRHTLPDLIVGFLIPLPMMALIFLIESSVGWVRWQGWAWQEATAAQVVLGVAGGLVMFAAVGVAEETLSRGYHLQNLAESMGVPAAVVVSSLLFSALHTFNPGFTLAAGAGLVLAGLFLATGWLRTRSLWLSIGLHLGWNFFEGTVFGFAVSGLDLFRVMRHQVEGPRWATGGSFGPEAGAVMLPALLLGAGIIWLYTRGRISRT
jgi:membrane protease YdiL (CAAX protease family)